MKQQILKTITEPTDLIFLACMAVGEKSDFMAQDDETSYGLIVGTDKDKGYFKSTSGFGTIVTPEEFNDYRNHTEEYYGDPWTDMTTAIYLKGFTGTIGVTCGLSDGTFTDQFNKDDSILTQMWSVDDDNEGAYVVLPEDTNYTKIYDDVHFEQLFRGSKIDDLLNEDETELREKVKIDMKGELLRAIEGKETLVVVGGSHTFETDSTDFDQTDDFDDFVLRVNGKTIGDVDSMGSGSILTVEQFQKWMADCEEITGEPYEENGSGMDAYIINNASGEIRLNVSLDDGKTYTKFDISTEINHQWVNQSPTTYVDVDDAESVIKVMDNTDVLKAVRDMKVSDLLKDDEESTVPAVTEETEEIKEPSLEETLKWYDDKKIEIENEDNDDEKDREHKLGIIATEREKAIKAHYRRENEADQTKTFDEQITWYDNMINIQDLIATPTEEDELKTEALKKNREFAEYFKSQSEKSKKFLSTKFDFQKIVESLKEVMNTIMKDRVDDYYDDSLNMQVIYVDQLQKVMDNSTDEFEKVLAELVEDTDKIALTFTVKEEAIFVRTQWAIEGSIGDGLEHKQDWYFPTDFIKNWKKVQSLWEDDGDDDWMDHVDDEDEDEMSDDELAQLLNGINTK